MSEADFNGICSECSHRETCEKPCAPVEKNLRQEGHVNETGDERIRVVWNGRKVAPFSHYPPALIENIPDQAVPGVSGAAKFVFPPDDDQAEGDQAPEEEFPVVRTDSKQTGVFIDRFFNRMSYPDLVVKYNYKNVDQAHTAFAHAKRRIDTLLELLTQKIMVDKLSRDRDEDLLSNGMKCFLLRTCFGMGFRDIGELLGLNPSTAGKHVRYITERVRAGAPVFVFEEDGDGELVGRSPTRSEAQAHSWAVRKAPDQGITVGPSSGISY